MKAMRFPWKLLAAGLFTASCDHPFPFLPEGTSWNPWSGEFRWWRGSVTLPPGFSYKGERSDTFADRFTNGRIVIRHDIGGYAGAYARPISSYHFSESSVAGSRVWVAHRPWGSQGRGLSAVTFPDAGWANFFTESSNAAQKQTIAAIAASFRPIRK